MNLVLVLLTVGAFWAGVFVARSFGWKAEYSLAPLGLSRPRGGLLVGTGVGVLVGVGAVIASMPVNLASALVLDRLGYSTESVIQGPFMRGLVRWVEESPGVAVPAIVLVVVIFGPAVEELVFRGAVFNGLYRLGGWISASPSGSGNSRKTARRVSFALSALASSGFFASLHLEPVLLPALLILAVILCALFERTGSLLPPFVAHATFNSFAVSLIILAGLGVFEIPI
ncbi:MAG: CPBP family intramembrane metalloprotease [Actinobacteria bacterium]|nr:CPBP family intramembrane metalloprotease [Actinomycetota bacterium]